MDVEVPFVRVVGDFYAVAFAFAVLLHLVFPAVDVCASMAVPGWALDASLWVVDLLLMLRKV